MNTMFLHIRCISGKISSSSVIVVAGHGPSETRHLRSAIHREDVYGNQRIFDNIILRSVFYYDYLTNYFDFICPSNGVVYTHHIDKPNPYRILTVLDFVCFQYCTLYV